jgi:hypothetical protein
VRARSSVWQTSHVTAITDMIELAHVGHALTTEPSQSGQESGGSITPG